MNYIVKTTMKKSPQGEYTAGSRIYSLPRAAFTSIGDCLWFCVGFIKKYIKFQITLTLIYILSLMSIGYLGYTPLLIKVVASSTSECSGIAGAIGQFLVESSKAPQVDIPMWKLAMTGVIFATITGLTLSSINTIYSDYGGIFWRNLGWSNYYTNKELLLMNLTKSNLNLSSADAFNLLYNIEKNLKDYMYSLAQYEQTTVGGLSDVVVVAGANVEKKIYENTQYLGNLTNQLRKDIENLGTAEVLSKMEEIVKEFNYIHASMDNTLRESIEGLKQAELQINTDELAGVSTALSAQISDLERILEKNRVAAESIQQVSSSISITEQVIVSEEKSVNIPSPEIKIEERCSMARGNIFEKKMPMPESLPKIVMGGMEMEDNHSATIQPTTTIERGQTFFAPHGSYKLWSDEKGMYINAIKSSLSSSTIPSQALGEITLTQAGSLLGKGLWSLGTNPITHAVASSLLSRKINTSPAGTNYPLYVGPSAPSQLVPYSGTNLSRSLEAGDIVSVLGGPVARVGWQLIKHGTSTVSSILTGSA